jgi:hypothetical protein
MELTRAGLCVTFNVVFFQTLAGGWRMPASFQSNILIGMLKTWQKIKYRPELYSPIDLWKRADMVLICFPDEYEHREAAEEAMRYIVESCPRKHFCVLTTKALPERWLNVELIRLRREDLNVFSLPNSDFIHYIQDKAIDTVIDLWPTFNLSNAYLSRRCGAELRVGFGTEHAPAFYNLLVVPIISGGPLRRRYEAMAETILNLERSEDPRES